MNATTAREIEILRDRHNRHEFINAYIRSTVFEHSHRWDADGNPEPCYAARDELSPRATMELVRQAESIRRAEYADLVAKVQEMVNDRYIAVGHWGADDVRALAWSELGHRVVQRGEGHELIRDNETDLLEILN